MPRFARSGFLRGAFKTPAVVATGTSAEEYVTDMVAGFQFTVEKVLAIVRVAGAGAGATRTFRLIKTVGTTDTTVASKVIALADVGTKGAVIDFGAITSGAFGDADKLTLDVASGGTAYTTLELGIEVIYKQWPQQ